MKIATGSDHAGFKLKEAVKKHLAGKGIEVKDFGTYTEDSVDYPDFAHPVAHAIEKKEEDMGILICGTGNGINMTANKHKGIRSALCWNKEVAALARLHNDANIIVLPARFVNEKEAKQMVEVFLKTEFEKGRHLNRINKI